MSHTANGPPRGGAKRGGRGGGRGGAVKKAGPAPARHIPWPEIFKHHISLVEGHLKMIDMVRKHTVEGSGNHSTVMSLIDRARTMLKDARTTAREFVPPKEAWREVPIGSSSATMYPGYSPKDHQYGKAAEEFGKQWSEARKKGIEFNTRPDGPQYEFGQSKGAKRRRLSADEGEKTTDAEGKPEEQSTDDKPLFFFDSGPAPLNNTAAKAAAITTEPRSSSSSAATGNTKEPNPIPDPVIEYENIDREVEARLKLKEEAKKSQKDKKRKRESGASTAAAAPSAEKPAKKKSKTKKDKNATGAAAEPADVEMQDVLQQQPQQQQNENQARDQEVENPDAAAHGKKKKKNKKPAATTDNDDDEEHRQSGEPQKKKSKKGRHKE